MPVQAAPIIVEPSGQLYVSFLLLIGVAVSEAVTFYSFNTIY